MAQVFAPSANDPAVFTTEKFPLLKDSNGNTYRTVVKANVNGSIDVYSKGTGNFGGDELIFQYSGTRNAADFTEGKFKNNPSAAFKSFFVETGSNGELFLKDVKTKWYSEAPPNSAERMTTLTGYKSIAATTPARQIPNGPTSLTIQTGAGTTTLISPAAVQNQPVNGTPQQTVQTTPLEIPEIEAEYNRDSYGPPLVYPTSLRTNKQDYIQFESFEYVGRRISPTATSSGGSPGIGDRNFSSTPKGTVILPVQPSISDVNTVQWGSGDLNAIGAFFASASYGAMSNPGKTVDDVINFLSTTFESNPNIGPGFKLWAAGRAASVSGLLSRVGGAVLNPNIELLFQGPQLRPFNFTFRLSARDDDEAETIKKIIRFFKEEMSVKTTKDNIFLKTPNIFQITYNNGDGDTHTSLNRIKKCALTAFNVDYTPDSQYMTFKDSAKGYPMTSYGLSMQFQELEPVTNKDYNELKDLTAIGY